MSGIVIYSHVIVSPRGNCNTKDFKCIWYCQTWPCLCNELSLLILQGAKLKKNPGISIEDATEAF